MKPIIVSIAGTFVTHEKTFQATIFMDRSTGLITDIGRYSLGADLVIPAHCLISPGFINAHGHCRECPPAFEPQKSECPDPKETAKYKETYSNAALAFIAGGITLVGDMPNKPNPPTHRANYSRQNDLSRKSQVPVMVYAGIGPDTVPFEYSLPIPYKAYTESIGDLNFKTDEDFFTALGKYKGKHRSLHCEAIRILHQHKGAQYHENRRPAEAESVCIEDILDYVEHKEPTARLKFCHCSVCKGIEAIIAAKKRGRDILCEVTIQHLYFCVEDLNAFTGERRKLCQMNPPMRSYEEQLGLIEHLRKGNIDMLITDYAPHTPEEKEKGMSGMAPDDCYGSFTTWLMKQHQFSPQDIARVCSYNPGKFMTEFLDPEEFGKGVGVIEPGYTASFTIIDPTKQHKVLRENLKTKAGRSPFEGITFPGSVSHTVIRGTVYPR